MATSRSAMLRPSPTAGRLSSDTPGGRSWAGPQYGSVMPFRVLADATVVLHLGFVLFVVLGGLIVARWRRVAWGHLPAAGWGAWIEFGGWVCPLTPIENWLRQQGGGTTYTSSFIEH